MVGPTAERVGASGCTPQIIAPRNPYRDVAHVELPLVVYATTWAVRYHHLGNFIASDGTLRSEHDLPTRATKGRAVSMMREWLNGQRAHVHLLVAWSPP